MEKKISWNNFWVSNRHRHNVEPESIRNQMWEGKERRGKQEGRHPAVPSLIPAGGYLESA